MSKLKLKREDDPRLFEEVEVQVVIQDKHYPVSASFEYHPEQARWFEDRMPGYVEITSLYIDISCPPYNHTFNLMDAGYRWLIIDQESQLCDELMDIANEYENHLKLTAGID